MRRALVHAMQIDALKIDELKACLTYAGTTFANWRDAGRPTHHIAVGPERRVVWVQGFKVVWE